MNAIQVKVPSIGDYDDVPVIEVHVKAGQNVNVDQALITLESDKATMDVPSPEEGKVSAVHLKVGDRVKEGTVIVSLEPLSKEDPANVPTRGPPATPETKGPAEPAPLPRALAPASPGTAPAPLALVPARGEEEEMAHASPAVRKFARELGVDVARLDGSGPHGRILKEDVERFVKDAVNRKGGGAGLDLPAWPRIDFSKFGPVETRPLGRIRKISAANLARNWVMIPHVTQNEEADITELDAFRLEASKESENGGGPKVTLLAFVVKACVAALKKYPEMNASLEGDSLILKKYFHIGFAADTPNGLLVPVIKDADQKGIVEIAGTAADLARKAREGKLQAGDMQGGTFSISSLGGIGGSFFTPIINAPEVGILGVSRAVHKPVWNGTEFKPRLLLPLSLSYDHRVIDGAAAARFITYLSTMLADMKRALL